MKNIKLFIAENLGCPAELIKRVVDLKNGYTAVKWDNDELFLPELESGEWAIFYSDHFGEVYDFFKARTVEELKNWNRK